MNMIELFEYRMERKIGEWLPIPEGAIQLDLGPGNRPMPGSITLDYPGWDALKDGLPADCDETIDVVHAYHFLEHLPGDRVVAILRDVERALVPGGIMNIIVPHYQATMAFEELDHKSFFGSETLSKLFNNKYFDKNREVPWRLRVQASAIIGVVERNVTVMTQLVKG